MFTNYYYTRHQGKDIYLSVATIDHGIEPSLFVDHVIVSRAIINMGTTVIDHEELSLKLEMGALKFETELSIDGTTIPFEKIKKKELKTILDEAGIYNEINPDPADRKPFDMNKVAIGLAVLSAGVAAKFFTVGLGKPIIFIPDVIITVAFFLLLGPFTSRINPQSMTRKQRSFVKYFLPFACMIGFQILLEKFFFSV